MTRDHAGRAEPVSRHEDLRTVNAELLRTAGKLIEAMTELVATECRLGRGKPKAP